MFVAYLLDLELVSWFSFVYFLQSSPLEVYAGIEGFVQQNIGYIEKINSCLDHMSGEGCVACRVTSSCWSTRNCSGWAPKVTKSRGDKDGWPPDLLLTATVVMNFAILCIFPASVKGSASIKETGKVEKEV